ncbi:MAG: hemin ABC transporter substrate-binding protein [Bacteroidia bacterium]
MKISVLKKIIPGLLSLGLLFTSCSRFGNKESETTKKDTVRIVCASKQLTELIFALGQGDKIVGVDISSTYPEEAKKITTIGYHRMLNAEGIISLKPTAFFYNGGADNSVGPDNVIPQLQKIGITVVQFRIAETFEDTKLLIQDLGKYFNVSARADSMCRRMDSTMRLAEEKRKQYADTPRVMIVHFGRAGNKYFPFGPKGAPNYILEAAGGVNVLDSTKKMRELSAEVLAETQPDVIIATDFGYDRLGADNFKAMPGISLTPAAKNNRIYRFEEHDLFYLGPRTGDNIIKLMELIHKKQM